MGRRRRRRSAGRDAVMSAITSNASPASTSCWQARTSARSRLSAMLCLAVASAAVLWSTLATDVAPPAAACTEKPPVHENTSSTRPPDAIEPTSARLSRWSRKCPVFCPWTTSASNIRPFSMNSTGSSGTTPSSAVPSSPTDADSPAATQDDRGGVDELVEGRDHGIEVRQPRPAVDLDDVRVVVAVDDEPGQPVVLAMHAAVPGRRPRLGQRPADVERGPELQAPERVVDRRGAAVVEDADADRRGRVPQADGDEFALARRTRPRGRRSRRRGSST